MTYFKLTFLRSIFALHLGVAFLLCLLIYIMSGLTIKALLICLGVFVLYTIISLMRSKSFVYKEDLLIVSYIFFGKKRKILRDNIDKVLYHKKKGERDWNYIKIYLKTGKYIKFSFSFISQSDRDDFFTRLSNYIEIKTV